MNGASGKDICMKRTIVIAGCLIALSGCVVEPEHGERDRRDPGVERQYDRDHHEDRRDDRGNEFRDERRDDDDHR
jgi:hypothetical protein